MRHAHPLRVGRKHKREPHDVRPKKTIVQLLNLVYRRPDEVAHKLTKVPHELVVKRKPDPVRGFRRRAGQEMKVRVVRGQTFVMLL